MLHDLISTARVLTQGVTDSEAAVAQMEADIEFPVTVTI